MKKITDRPILAIFLFSLFILLISSYAYADQDVSIPGESYIVTDGSNFDYTYFKTIDTFFYGAHSIGTLQLDGTISNVTTYEESNAYGVTGPVSIRYSYDGSYQLSNPDEWFVDGDGTRWIRSYDLGFLNNIAHGCIMIEKSNDKITWEPVINPIKDYFSKARNDDESLIYTIPEFEIMNGIYYRVVVAYRFTRRVSDGFVFFDGYEHKNCVEVYEFYVASDKNYVTFCDISDGSLLANDQISTLGFQIYRNGSSAQISIQDKKDNCGNYETIVDPGEYQINIMTKLGKEYNFHFSVENGLYSTPLKPNVFESDRNSGFHLNDTPAENRVLITPLTSLSLAVPSGTELKANSNKYGINGKSISFYLSLIRNPSFLDNNWMVVYDSWGKNNNELVAGLMTGEIGKGALIIQKSYDGMRWIDAEAESPYANGLYTTDYATHYGKSEQVLIYTPSGEDIIKGTYFRVLFAYQIYNEASKRYRDCVEKYDFYVCSNELNAVTFHNLSIADSLAEQFTDIDENTINVYQGAETLLTGSYTTTGFKLDKSLNQSVQYTVRHNGETVYFLDCDITGRYDISLISAIGDTQEVTIYVDRSTPEEAMETYFKNGFLTDKRIFSEDEYPVYEAGETSYHISEVSDTYIPLYGEIRNLTTGSVITIEQTPEEKTGVLTEAGDYSAIFSTSKGYFTGNIMGDARVFTFRFHIIPQGTAPGPVINQSLLKEYATSTVMDANPIYYGLTYSSAGKGNITLAFADKDDAIKYAYNYEKGTVEIQGNGGYRYTGSFLVSQKTKFDSAWDLTDAVRYFAELAVQRHAFDLSDEFTYLTLTPQVLESTKNLRKLELPQSVTIFANDQQRKFLTNIDALPLINDKTYSYLDPNTGEITRGFLSFEFVTDKYQGIDSNSVIIIDSEGKQHSINYSESVGLQLRNDNCPSGIITIHEETLYGDAAEYKAIYIAPFDNQTQTTLLCKQNNSEKPLILSKEMAESYKSENIIIADSFCIKEINDPLDPYALVIVRNNLHEEIFTAKDLNEIEFSAPGIYNITCVNRMGYGYSIPIVVNDSSAASTLRNELIDTEIRPAYLSEVNHPTNQAPENQDEKVQSKENREETTNSNNTTLIILIVVAALIPAIILFIYQFKKDSSRQNQR